MTTKPDSTTPESSDWAVEWATANEDESLILRGLIEGSVAEERDAREALIDAIALEKAAHAAFEQALAKMRALVPASARERDAALDALSLAHDAHQDAYIARAYAEFDTRFGPLWRQQDMRVVRDLAGLPSGICAHCGAGFRTENAKAKYCSGTCHVSGRREKLKAAI